MMADNQYTNKMRMAVRTLKNPTAIPVDVVQHKDYIELRVASSKDFSRLALKSKMNFISYLNAMADYIASEGSVVYVTGIEGEGI